MNEHIEHLKEIRSMMERSSKFLSLSGLSGVSAGIVALVSAFLVYTKKVKITGNTDPKGILQAYPADQNFKYYLLQIAVVTLLVALVFGVYFTVRKAKKQNVSVWNNLSKKLLLHLAVPLLGGGIFSVGLVFHGYIWIAFPATLIFYGLALVNASTFTVRDVYYLGIFEVILGLISMFFTGYTLLFWAFGFGVLHILYGAIMYFKYEK